MVGKEKRELERERERERKRERERDRGRKRTKERKRKREKERDLCIDSLVLPIRGDALIARYLFFITRQISIQGEGFKRWQQILHVTTN